MLRPSQARPGLSAQWLIGMAGSGAADIHPVRIVETAFGYDDRGRQGLVALVIQRVTAQEHNGGGTYFRTRNILVANLDTRPSPDFPDPIPGFDDVDIEVLWEHTQQERRTFLLTGPVTQATEAAPEAVAATADEVGLPALD